MSNPNVTMVAFHGSDKPASLESLLKGIFEEIERILCAYPRGIFEAYTQYQIHATLIGMEVDIIDGKLFNHWFNKNRNGQKCIIDVYRLQEIVEERAQHAPLFTIRFGGFREAYCDCDEETRKDWHCVSGPSEFHSCGKSAYQGSFYISSSGKAMLSGWPVEGPHKIGEFPRCLYDFRKKAEEAGFLDKYHSNRHPHWKDDDCFIRLGTFSKELPAEQRSAIEKNIRQYLSKSEPIIVDINVEDVWIVLYRDPPLRQANVLDRISLSDFLNDPTTVERLYEKVLQLRSK